MKKYVYASILLVFLVGLPLLGARSAGYHILEFLDFPPQTEPTSQPPFSPWAFGLMAAVIVLVLAPFEWRIFRMRRQLDAERPAQARFPWWGWAGVALTLASWSLAWTQFEWFAPFQIFVFTPLWLGFIVVINALTQRRTGSCMLTSRPAHLAALFVVSAVFWWFFEYLNRFARNWHYLGISGLTAGEYFVFATLPFSTVLPAVMSTEELLSSYRRCGAGLRNFVKLRLPRRRGWAVVGLLLSMGALYGVGRRPDIFFPFLWMAPLFVLTSLQAVAGRTTLFAPVRAGNWQRLYRLAAAALLCGFFWEMWNAGSLARWVYTVPYVGRFKLFEMPLLGYAGYLPFGWECAVIADFVLNGKREKPSCTSN